MVTWNCWWQKNYLVYFNWNYGWWLYELDRNLDLTLDPDLTYSETLSLSNCICAVWPWLGVRPWAWQYYTWPWPAWWRGSAAAPWPRPWPRPSCPSAWPRCRGAGSPGGAGCTSPGGGAGCRGRRGNTRRTSPETATQHGSVHIYKSKQSAFILCGEDDSGCVAVW